MEKKLKVEISPMGWNQYFDCKRRPDAYDVGNREAIGSVELSGSAGKQLFVCSINFMDDPLSCFEVLRRENFWSRGERREVIKVRLKPTKEDEYMKNNRYPCHILIFTSEGVRFIDLVRYLRHLLN